MRHVLITGGSRGIGAATVRAFARAGYAVSFFYLNSGEAAAALAAETGAAALRCDVADEAAVLAAVRSLPPVDVLVNNAGVSHVGLISDITPDQWDRLFAVNVKGIYHTVRAVLPDMLRKQAGSIVNLGSIWGQAGASCEAAYSAAKGAVLALTQALARELGPSGIRVNAVSPGLIDTEMNAHLSAEELEAFTAEVPLGRAGTPEETAAAILWLAEAPYVTGQNLPVNGGYL